MSSNTFAYLIVAFIAFLEGGEFSVLFASFLMRFADLDLMILAGTLVGTFILSDMLWYRYGYALYRLPVLRHVEPLMENLDQRIRTKPFLVALVARFSYGIHHATLARYRRNGVSVGRMFLYILGTLSVWLAVVSMVVAGFSLLSPAVGGVFRYVEFLFTLGFVIFFFTELGLSARLRRTPSVLDHAYGFVTLLAMRAGGLVRYFYGVLLGAVFLLIVSTPLMVREGLGPITEEGVEILILLTLGFVGLVVYRSYEHRLLSVQDTLLDMSKHVGALNLQAVQLEAMYRQFAHLPENKRELTRLLGNLNANVLAAVDVPWVLTRVVECNNGRTLTEHLATRADVEQVPQPTVSNKVLLGQARPRGYYVYRSEHENLPVRAACAVPRRTLSRHQELVLRTAVNSVAMVYMVFKAQEAGREEEQA